ncbi:MAG: hypothetical protein EBS31_09050 [Burkholderiaceae bacterium]|nr:hypothetical protein [Burkholderiaceae bacterium]
MTTTTFFENKADILAELWLDYRDNKEFADFIEYNDLGLPLAYAFANGIIDKATPLLEQFINESFNLLLAGLEIKEDAGFETLDDVLRFIDGK